MADRLVKLTDLKQVFGHFEEMSALVDKIKDEVHRIEVNNKLAAGDDDIGRQYHQQADKGTVNLVELTTNVRNKLLVIGINGATTADLFDAADNDAADLTL